MSQIHVEKPVTTPPEELLRALEVKVLGLPNFRLFVDSYRIEGSTVTFEGSKGVSGTLEARPGLLVVDVTLSGMASLMKPMIESRLKDVLSTIA